MVILLGKTEVDFNKLKQLSEEHLLKSPYLKDMKDYLTLLNSFKNTNISKQNTLEEPGHLLRHISYTFAVITNTNTLFDLIRTTGLEVEYKTTNEPNTHLVILSANLEDWRTVIINDLDTLRPILNKILILLELEGFSKLWLGYRKQKTDEHTFKLVRRRD
jgi:hypothetical protein